MARLSNQLSWYTVVVVVAPATVSLTGNTGNGGAGASVASCGLAMTARTVERRCLLGWLCFITQETPFPVSTRGAPAVRLP